MTTGMSAPWFVSEGVSAETIGSGEPRLRPYRGGDAEWFPRAAELVRRMRSTSVRVPLLSR